jgi:hypothetical protein
MAKNKQKPKKASKLNMLIARTHRLSTRLVGMQMTSGTLVGIILSAIQMSAGFIIIGQGLIHGSILLIGLVLVAGVALAMLIERLSLGGLAGIRVAMLDITRLEDQHSQMILALPVPQSDEEKEAQKQKLELLNADLARRLGALKNRRTTAIVFAIIGMVLSAGLGDIFWHALFISAGNMDYVYSTACATVIALTFLHSELFKDMMDRVLKEILSDLHLMKAAVAAEGQSMQVDLMAGAFDAVRENEDVRLPAQGKVERAVVRSLANAADQYAVLEGEVTIYEDRRLPSGQPSQQQLPAPARGKYVHNRDELLRQLASNPTMSVAAIAAYFQISKSTAHAWLQKVRVP